MNKRFWILACWTIFALSITSNGWSATPISSIKELQAIQNDLNADYYLTNNIDASVTQNWNNGQGFSPIGNQSSPFTGELSGNGFSISNLYINRPGQDFVGLFGSLSQAQITEVKLVDVDIAGNNRCGGITGYFFQSTMSNSSVNGSISGNNQIGGIIGESYNGNGLTNCSSDIFVNGVYQVGGIVGKTWDGILNNYHFCYSSGSIIASGNQSGGFSGYNKSSDFLNCYFLGSVQGQNQVGGIVGYTTENAGIHNCYSHSSVSGNNQIGGIIGYCNSYHDGVSHTYHNGSISGSTNVGGFIGYYQAGTLSLNHWCFETANLAPNADVGNLGDVAEIQSQTDNAMRIQSTFTDWDFENTWIMNVYPILQEPDFSPTFYPIRNLEDLQNIKNNLDADYYLTKDIDCSETSQWNAGQGFEPIGTTNNPFTGTFNGNGFVLKGLFINRNQTDRVGLFGSISYSHLENVRVTQANINGRSQVGSLVGYMHESTVANVTGTGTITGTQSRIGGLIGEAYNARGIENCQSYFQITGVEETGGIVGRIWDGIENSIERSSFNGTINCSGNKAGGIAGYNKSGDFYECFSKGTITGLDKVGGIVGYTTENAGIYNCYAQMSIQGRYEIGGIVGFCNSYHDGLYNNYVASSILGQGSTGGLIGRYWAGT